FQPESKRQLIGRNCLEIVRSLEPGRSVECSARSLNQLEMLIRSHVCRALKKHMLEQVSESRSPCLLIRRSNMVPEIHSDDRRSMIFRQGYEQPVIEPEGFYRNSH